MLKFHGVRSFRGNCVELYIVEPTPDGSFREATTVTFTERSPDEVSGGPLFKLKEPEAQALIDALWDAGLRPSEGSGSAGAMLATQHHLADMRKIVAKKLGVLL